MVYTKLRYRHNLQPTGTLQGRSSPGSITTLVIVTIPRTVAAKQRNEDHPVNYSITPK